MAFGHSSRWFYNTTNHENKEGIEQVVRKLTTPLRDSIATDDAYAEVRYRC